MIKTAFMVKVACRCLLWDSRGVTLPLVAISLTALIGFAGLGVETGLWYTIKRQDQSAADFGALSGAMEVAAGKSYPSICALAQRVASSKRLQLPILHMPDHLASVYEPWFGANVCQ